MSHVNFYRIHIKPYRDDKEFLKHITRYRRLSTHQPNL